MLRSLSTRSLENLTLSDDAIENNEVDKLVNWIIKKLKLTAVAIKNDEVDKLSGSKANQTDRILAKPKNIRKLLKVTKSAKVRHLE